MLNKEEMIYFISEKLNKTRYDSYSDDEDVYPVYIWDILYYFNWHTTTYQLVVEWLWRDTRTDLSAQKIDCIKYIYKLVKNRFKDN